MRPKWSKAFFAPSRVCSSEVTSISTASALRPSAATSRAVPWTPAEVRVRGADVSAFRRQPHRVRPAQARGRAGNQGNAILKSHGSAPSAPFPR